MHKLWGISEGGRGILTLLAPRLLQDSYPYSLLLDPRSPSGLSPHTATAPVPPPTPPSLHR